ncbi:MAG: GNAT family N-acetyltransferase [Flavobacteriales bacterium]|nr:GNAT family N-acetyltransferase [Flavobacteriales bacterium]
MRIQAADPADIPFIRAIALATWPVAYKEILSPAQLAYMLEIMYSEAALADQMTVKGHRFLLAHHDDRAMGFAAFEHHCRGERSTRLHKLYVLPEVHGSGAGRSLHNAVEEAARSAGDTQLELNVNRFNPSRSWYERIGYRIARDEVIDLGNGYVMDDHVMVKPL